MTESGQPNRDQELENIVDEIDENVAAEREAQDVPGKQDADTPEPTA